MSAGTQSLIFEPTTDEIPKQVKTQISVISRLRQHEENQLLLDYTNGGNFAGHIDVQLSISYLLTDPKPSIYNENGTDWNLAFAGTIEFDFYVGTRDSSPVIGRRYNPSLQYYYSLNQLSG